MTDAIHCPKCGCEFELSDVIHREIEEQARAAMQRELALHVEAVRASADVRVREKEGELAAARDRLDVAVRREGELLRQQREVAEREQQLTVDFERRIAEEATRIRRQEAKVAEERFARESSNLVRRQNEDLAEMQSKLSVATAREAEVMRQQRLLAEREQQLLLDAERRIGEETARIREREASVTAQRVGLEREQQALRDQEHRTTIEGLRTHVADLQRKIQQGSQQSQGEAQETLLSELLTEAFPHDEIEDVPKGVVGADAVHRVRAADGRECGSVAWESKRTKAWSDAWLRKVRDDQRAAGAACAVIVTQALPPDVKHFGLKDDVWVCAWPYAVALGAALRAGLRDVATAKHVAEGRGEKMQMLYEYLTGPEFRNRVAGFVEALADMHEDFERERRAMTTAWKRREKILSRARENVTAMYGDLQGMAGRQLADLPALALESAPSRVDAESDRPSSAAGLPRRLPVRGKLDVSEAP